MRAPVLRTPTTRVRAWSAGLLILLTVLAAIVTMVALWARTTVYDTDRFMRVVQPALDDPAFYDGLSVVVAEQALTALDLDARVAETLRELDVALATSIVTTIDPEPEVLARLSRIERPSLELLAPPISAAMESRITELIHRSLTSEAFAARLPTLVGEAHAGGVALVRGNLEELPNVYLEEGDVRLDLVPLIVDVLRRVTPDVGSMLPDVELPSVLDARRETARLQLAASLGTRLPEDFGQVTILDGERLREVQGTAAIVDRSVWAVATLTLVLVIASILAAMDRRRALVQLAGGLLAGLAVTLVAIRSLERFITRAVADPQADYAARAVFGQVFSSLRDVALLVALAALVAGGAALIAGRRQTRSAGRTTADDPRGELVSHDAPGPPS